MFIQLPKKCLTLLTRLTAHTRWLLNMCIIKFQRTKL